MGVITTIPAVNTSTPQRFDWLLVGLIAQSLMGISIFVFNYIYHKVFQNKSGSKSFIIFALCASGAFRGFCIGKASTFFDLDDPINIVIRSINSGLTTLIWLGLIGLLIEAQSSYIREYQDLYQRFLMLKSGRLPDGRELNSGRLSEIAEQVSEMTSPVRSKLALMEDGEFTDEQIRDAVDELQKVIKEQIRPLSHRLWFDRTSHLLRFRFANLFFDALKSADTPIIFFSSVISFTIFFGVTVAYGYETGLIIGGIFGISIVLILFAERFIAKKFNIKLILVHPIVLILLPVVPIYLVQIYLEYIGSPKWLPYTLFGFIGVIPLFAILITMLAQSLIDKAKIIDILTAQITSGYVEEHLNAIAKMAEDSEIASYLHSSLQSELTAIALKLDQAARSGNRDQVKSIIQYAQIVIERDLTVNFHAGEHSPLERINALLDAWRGIAEIKINLRGIELCETQVVTDISQIIEEAVSDSVRFGNANVISIKGSTSPDHYYFIVTDNGTSKNQGGSGLGTILLDEIAPNLWRREFALGGTNLEVWIPLNR